MVSRGLTPGYWQGAAQQLWGEQAHRFSQVRIPGLRLVGVNSLCLMTAPSLLLEEAQVHVYGPLPPSSKPSTKTSSALHGLSLWLQLAASSTPAPFCHPKAYKQNCTLKVVLLYIKSK